MSTARLISDEQQREDQHDALDQRQVAVDHRVDRHVAEALIGEQPLDDHRAADQEGELHADQRQRRQRGVRQRLAQDHLRLREALHPRQHDIVEVITSFSDCFSSCAMIAASGSASASAGMNMWPSRSRRQVEAQPQRCSRTDRTAWRRAGRARGDRRGPRSSNTGTSTPNSRISTSPQRKSGIDSAAPLATSMPASTAVPRSRAPTMRQRRRRARARSAAPRSTAPASPAGGSSTRPARPGAERDRGAEIALQHAAAARCKNCSRIGLVEPVERPQPGDVGLGRAGRQHHGDRVARRHADHARTRPPPRRTA